MAATKRARIEPPSGPRFARRDEKGQFTQSVDVGRSLSAEARGPAKKTVSSGQGGDQGDQKGTTGDAKSGKKGNKKDGKKGDAKGGKKGNKKGGKKKS